MTNDTTKEVKPTRERKTRGRGPSMTKVGTVTKMRKHFEKLAIKYKASARALAKIEKLIGGVK